ncbi:hypothetical protein BASA83_009870 [Batrachochytrium salamandrivorans]|nr:hypothetical protein BASA83_009870 [Batrachochytrium salamandrivorans]
MQKKSICCIKVDFGNKGYSKIKPFLDDASDKLKADVSYNLQQVTAALSNIEKKIDSAKLEEYYGLNPSLFTETATFSTRISRGIRFAAALLQMSPRKVPGDNGISTAFYQAVLYMLANTQEGVPPTPFARALLRVCGQVFASATIPHAWLCASIVSIDKKDGDPLNPGDKRGIALINVGLKLVCNVLQMRIEQFFETNNLLSYE